MHNPLESQLHMSYSV